MKFPNLNDSKLAEFIGILLGDGSVSIYKCRNGNKIKLQHRVQITLNSKNKKYIQYISVLIEHLFDIKPIVKFRKNENACDILIFRKSIIDFLISKVGLKLSPKWNRAVIPELFLTKDLEKYVLRGYFDTDGSVVITNNNGTIYPRLEMKICPSPMRKSFIDILRRLNFRFGIYNIDNNRTRIQINGKEQLIKWVNDVRIKNPEYLQKINNYFIARGGISEQNSFEPPTFPPSN